MHTQSRETPTLVRQFNLDGKQVDIGSDYHLEGEGVIGRAVARIKREQRSEVLFCIGDLCNAEHGEDTSPRINEFLTGVASLYDRVIFTPGNHDLRGRENPWGSFKVPGNVIYPNGEEPKVVDLGGRKVLVADLFYDMKFIDPSKLGFSADDVAKQYAESNDGRHLLHGDTSTFQGMTERAAKLLQPDVDILATHTLPHPSLVTFRVPEMTEEIKRLAAESGLPFICNPEEDAEQAKRYSKPGKPPVTAQGYRDWWNNKSIFMGSNVLEHPKSNPKDGLWAVHGHHHRIDLKSRAVQGRTINIATHQPNPWRWVGGMGSI